jgi:hypothetical protein
MIQAILKRHWKMPNGAKTSRENREEVEVAPGNYELDRVPNPFGHKAPWLVLKGTLIGMAEGAWRQWINDADTQWDDFEIIIDEDGVLLTPPD